MHTWYGDEVLSVVVVCPAVHFMYYLSLKIQGTKFLSYIKFVDFEALQRSVRLLEGMEAFLYLYGMHIYSSAGGVYLSLLTTRLDF